MDAEANESISLQMPPEGGGYNPGKLRAGPRIPSDLVARDESGAVVRLPNRVSAQAIEHVPRSVAVEECAMPLALSPDERTIAFLVPEGLANLAEADVKLQFILNRRTKFLYAHLDAVLSLTEVAYLDGEIENCDFRYPAWCPRRFGSLFETDDPRCRFCPVCSRVVRCFESPDERRLRTAAGLLSTTPDRLPDRFEVATPEFVDLEEGCAEPKPPRPAITFRAYRMGESRLRLSGEGG